MLELFFSLWYLWVFLILVTVWGLFKPKIKGFIGEKTVSAILLMLDQDKYKVINDVVIKVDGKTSQIDHVVVSNYGIFVIETKNYSGWIYGDDYSQYWTQVIYKRKEKLYNPVRQNYGHVQTLKHHLADYPDVPFIPIIVFSINADLKVKTKTDVVYTVNLLKTIRKYSEESISDKLKEKLYVKILSLNVTDQKTRKGHVETIHREKVETQRKVDQDICPKCGGTLISRKGKYGSFKGCSNYPKCKFTMKI